MAARASWAVAPKRLRRISVTGRRCRYDSPEVAPEDPSDVAHVLDGQRLVEAVALLQDGTDGRVACPLPGRRADRVARQDEQADEEDHARPEEDEDHLQQPPDDVPAHRSCRTDLTSG